MTSLLAHPAALDGFAGLSGSAGPGAVSGEKIPNRQFTPPMKLVPVWAIFCCVMIIAIAVTPRSQPLHAGDLLYSRASHLPVARIVEIKPNHDWGRGLHGPAVKIHRPGDSPQDVWLPRDVICASYFVRAEVHPRGLALSD
jgi:hypothetical protein